MEPISPSVCRRATRNIALSVRAVAMAGAGRARVATSRGPGLSLPGRDRCVGEPDRRAAALTQGRIVGRRVRGPVPLLWNVIATVGIGLKGINLPRTVAGTPHVILPQEVPSPSTLRSHGAIEPDTKFQQ